eukprot:5928855-Pleurochrysis_carterae.AAC.1
MGYAPRVLRCWWSAAVTAGAHVQDASTICHLHIYDEVGSNETLALRRGLDLDRPVRPRLTARIIDDYFETSVISQHTYDDLSQEASSKGHLTIPYD